MIVVDASIAVKWFVPEKNSEKAEELLFSGKKLVAPEIIRTEVAAALTRLYRMNDLSRLATENLLKDWCQSLSDETVTLEPVACDFSVATKLSMDIRHSLQDCLYLAVAKRLNVPLITADEKFLKKTADSYDVIPL